MEDRLGELYLELTDLSGDEYANVRLREVLKHKDVAAETP